MYNKLIARIIFSDEIVKLVKTKVRKGCLLVLLFKIVLEIIAS
jgi:hypothetical protein